MAKVIIYFSFIEYLRNKFLCIIPFYHFFFLLNDNKLCIGQQSLHLCSCFCPFCSGMLVRLFLIKVQTKSK